MATKRQSAISFCLLSAAATASANDVTGPVTFVGVAPCRIIETRAGLGFSGLNGPPGLAPNSNRTFQITGTVTGLPAQCGIPTTAVAISVNFTATGFTGPGNIRAFPAGGTLPTASVLNYQLENIANSTTVPLGPSGGGQFGITVRADVSGTNFIADVNGYYVPRPFTLESGHTLIGPYAFFVTAAAPSHFSEVAWAFQFPLSSAPAAPNENFIPVGGASTTNCPGTAENPQALAGHLCVYESAQANRVFSYFIKESTSSFGSDRFGVGLGFNSTAAGTSRSRGTWAVTAP